MLEPLDMFRLWYFILLSLRYHSKILQEKPLGRYGVSVPALHKKPQRPIRRGARHSMTWRQFILALGLHTAEETAEDGFEGLIVVVRELKIIDMDDVVRLRICERLGDTWAWVAPGLERQHVAIAEAYKILRVLMLRLMRVFRLFQHLYRHLSHILLLMPQSMARLEEEVHGIRESLDEQRVVIDIMARDFSRFTVWVAKGISQLLVATGATYMRLSSGAKVIENQGADEELSNGGPQHLPLPVEILYIPEPEYPEYLAPSEDMAPIKDQPLPADASPTTASPGYVADSDPDEDPKEDPEEDHDDYPVDRRDGDDDPSNDDDDDDDDDDST
uniref:Uncharacterized protein n=1 Tax=Tanacetum cinerariifolium TaxID=118510 RepID=A0A6L2NAN3_TANCI|nr:hypothetical protein [Tanacetum cinerariifolium]